MNKRILVVGASGMLGKPVAHQLLADGYIVRVLTRDPEKATAKLGETFEIVPGDVEKPETLPSALAGCQGVHINLAGGPTIESYRRVEFQGTANITNAAIQNGIEKITYISSASLQQKNTSFAPTQAKLLAEEAICSSRINYSIFRASWFMESLPLFVQGNRAFLIGKQPNPVHWIAANDYAHMVSKAYRTPATENKIFDLYGPEAITMLDALNLYCAIVQPNVKVSQLPIWLAMLIAKLTSDEKMQDAVRLMAYYNNIIERKKIDEENLSLGTPTTTLRQWCKR